MDGVSKLVGRMRDCNPRNHAAEGNATGQENDDD